MSASRGPGCGTGSVRSLRTDGGPNRPMAAAFIVSGMDGTFVDFAGTECSRLLTTIRASGGAGHNSNRVSFPHSSSDEKAKGTSHEGKGKKEKGKGKRRERRRSQGLRSIHAGAG